MEKYDAIVIGGGPGGYACAIRLAQLKKKTLLVEKEELGGECTNYGCIPSKHLINQAKKIWQLGELVRKNIVNGSVQVNMKAIAEESKQVVQRLRQGISYLLKENGVISIRGEASITDNHTVEVATGNGRQIVEADNIVVATGTEPVKLPTIPTDGNRVIDYKRALFLEEVPGKMLVVGGGAVGVELGTAFAQLGTQVTVVELLDQLLPGVDVDASRHLKRSMEKMGVKIHLRTTVTGSSYHDSGVKVELSDGTVDTFDFVLVAVGKRPTSWTSELRKLGVELDGKGFVKTDERMRTSVENVYAVGDVTGPPFLAHKAHRQAVVAAENIAGYKTKFYGLIPYGIFSTPEVAFVGLTETEASSKGLRPRSVRFPYAALGRAVADGEDGFVKITVDLETKRVLGAVVVGPHATEVISVVTALISGGADAEKAAEPIHIHPTYSEAVGEAVHMFLRKAIHYVVK